jgi:hypothetical protein
MKTGTVFLGCLAGTFAVALLGLLSAPATADDSGRLRLVQVVADGKDGVKGLFGPAFSAVSPDGAHVYVSGEGAENDVAVFARDLQPSYGEEARPG